MDMGSLQTCNDWQYAISLRPSLWNLQENNSSPISFMCVDITTIYPSENPSMIYPSPNHKNLRIDPYFYLQ